LKKSVLPWGIAVQIKETGAMVIDNYRHTPVLLLYLQIRLVIHRIEELAAIIIMNKPS
jgi:hypothetical protein